MARTAHATPQLAYREDAHRYDARTELFAAYRRGLVELLPLRPGDVVLDVGCGTGLCFAALRERVGPDGVIVGVDAAPDMLDLAARRAAEQGWRNVTLHRAAAEDLELARPVDHVLFCAVHDVLQSEAALDNVLARVRTLHGPYVWDFTGFDRPWARLAERVVDLRVEELAMGAGYQALGRVPSR
jgi:ubiquinone/menaquinone biosynthesis C-methylase UbiE